MTSFDSMDVEGYKGYPPEALTGTEYGGAPSEFRYNNLQPKPAGAQLSAREQLYLGYMTGEDDGDWRSLEDRRQMMGLRPASGTRPEWLTHVSPRDRLELTSEAELQGYTDTP